MKITPVAYKNQTNKQQSFKALKINLSCDKSDLNFAELFMIMRSRKASSDKSIEIPVKFLLMEDDEASKETSRFIDFQNLFYNGDLSFSIVKKPFLKFWGKLIGIIESKNGDVNLEKSINKRFLNNQATYISKEKLKELNAQTKPVQIPSKELKKKVHDLLLGRFALFRNPLETENAFIRKDNKWVNRFIKS